MLSQSHPVDWILPAVLVISWALWWAVRRNVPWWFFAAGVALAVLCGPAGLLAGRVETSGPDCSAGDLCFSMHEVDFWVNGLFGLFATGLLALLTMIAQAVAAVVRRAASPGRGQPGDRSG